MKQCRLLLAATALMLTAFTYNLTAQTVDTHRFSAVNRPVPDGHASGLSDRRTIDSTVARISRLRVTLSIAGEFNGDLYAYLRHVTPGTTNFCVLLNRAGKSASLPSGYADSGLSVTLDDAAAAGDIHGYRATSPLAPGVALGGSWQPDGRNTNPQTVLETSPRTTNLGSFIGTDPDGEWTLFVADLEAGGTNLLASWELEISGPTAPAITWPTPADIVYGTALGVAQLNATASVPGSFTYNPAAGIVLNAGTGQVLTAVFQPSNTLAHVAATNSVLLTVLKRPLTITAEDKATVFGQSLPALTLTYAGFVNGDTAAGLDVPATLSTLATSASPSGTYPITVGGAADLNYAITFVPGTLTVGRASSAGAIAASKNPARPGEAVALSFALSAVAPGAGVPTGTVQFIADGAPVGAPSPIVAGLAVLNLSTLPAGYHTIKAWYEGDANFRGATNTLAAQLLINTPPVAGADSMQRVATNFVKVLLSALLANDSDADGNAISFVSLGTPSAAGATVSLNGDWVYYFPAAGSTNGDSFTYTITDGFNATATGTVQVAVQTPPVPAPNLQIVDLGNGSFRLRFDGIPGVSYRIESTDDAALLIWQTLGSSTADAAGQFTFTDTPPGGQPRRFYRSVHP